ncbi:hypothetical protein ECP030526011_3137 [Escherichia coli P0305260.11]|nr:hypothetical protein ECP03052601_1948 [Escherichia coli P0305260.1]ENC33658.1 hypothetical protein ECP02994389_1699 [Escherichia coli P0299438.9]ENE06239.1 hypothetical protein ECP03052602_3159 [Escherichia coli P0305260.2]ENF74338.1 hypothetical protein ECP030526010_3143 [Escherichia coli P0305260.10]ENF81746.1 hypothetical protein ECP030526011_3137 [Escherichia coli P0305260.11]ENF88207.1 hypothetical protein ECP030526012_1686 [Escherichia coli P0305260.12]ENF95771.1 hypothetical protein
MYGTCETLCRELAVKYPGDMPLMLVIWSPEEIQALADGMDISLSDHEIRTVLARLEDIPEDQRTESGISSGVVMEIISNVSENRQVTVPAELLASLIQTAEQALWKRVRCTGNSGHYHLFFFLSSHLIIFFPEGCRGDIPQTRVTTLTIVENLNVFPYY